MYRPLSLSLLLLVALGAAPAVAGGRSGGHVSFGFHSGHASGFHGSHFFAGQFGHPFHSQQFGQSRFFAPFAWGDWGWGDWADWDGGGGGGPGSVVVLAMAPPAPPAAARPQTEARASVETTTAGVTIIRGPGSHHLTE